MWKRGAPGSSAAEKPHAGEVTSTGGGYSAEPVGSALTVSVSCLSTLCLYPSFGILVRGVVTLRFDLRSSQYTD